MALKNSAPTFEPEIVLLYCRQSLSKETRPVEGRQAGNRFTANMVLLPCSSKIELPYMLRILEKGADGILLVACPEKQCQFLVGNERAKKRVAYARNLLGQVGMEEERLGMELGGGLTIESLMDLAGQRAELVRGLGPNPMKGDNRK